MTSPSTTPRARARLQLVPVPSSAPPFDDELAPADRRPPPERDPRRRQTVQGALALTFALPSGVPAIPQVPPRLRVVGRDLARRQGPVRADDATRPDVARWAAMVVQAAVEVVAGDRPLTQLVRWTTAEVYEQLHWRRQRLARQATGSQPAAPRRAVVSSIHVCQPSDDVAEACATVRVGPRALAVAVRLETDRDSWRCTAISLG